MTLNARVEARELLGLRITNRAFKDDFKVTGVGENVFLFVLLSDRLRIRRDHFAGVGRRSAHREQVGRAIRSYHRRR